MSYKKYIKYINKYEQLIQSGGLPCADELFLNNRFGTCWVQSIQMLFIFGDQFSDIVQKNLSFDTETLMKNASSNSDLINCLPINFFNDNDYTKGLKDTKKIQIKVILDEFHKRYNIKIKDHKMKHTAQLVRTDSIICEKDFTSKIFDLFDFHISDGNIAILKRPYDATVYQNYLGLAGTVQKDFFSTLLLSIFFFGKKIRFTTYFINKISPLFKFKTEPYLYYNFGKIDMSDVSNSYGILINYFDKSFMDCCFVH